MNKKINFIDIDEKDINIICIASTLTAEKLTFLKGIVIGLQLQEQQTEIQKKISITN